MRIYLEISAPIGAWEVKLEIMTDKSTERPADRRTCGAVVSLPRNLEMALFKIVRLCVQA